MQNHRLSYDSTKVPCGSSSELPSGSVNSPPSQSWTCASRERSSKAPKEARRSRAVAVFMRIPCLKARDGAKKRADSKVEEAAEREADLPNPGVHLLGP